MPLTWAQLNTVVSGMLGDSGNIAYSSAVVDAAVLQAARSIATELLVCEEDTTLTTVATQANYPLDSTAPGGTFSGQPIRIKKVMLQLSSYNWVEILPESTKIPLTYPMEGLPIRYAFNPLLFGDYRVSWSPGYPTLTLYPAPNAVYTLRVYAVTIPGDSTANPNGPSLPPDAEDLCVLRAVKRLMSTAGNRPLYMDIEAEEVIETTVAKQGRERAVR